VRRYVTRGSPASMGVGSSFVQTSTSTKPAASRRERVSSGVGKKVGGASRVEPRESRCSEDPLDVSRGSALGSETPAGPQARREISEEGVVIPDPVKRRSGQHGIHRPLHGEGLGQIRSDILDPLAEPGQSAARFFEHGRRGVESDHRPLGQSLEQDLGDPARAAARVQHALSAFEPQPLDDGESPAIHRVGDPVVGRRVPVARHGEGSHSGRSALSTCHRIARRIRRGGPSASAAAVVGVDVGVDPLADREAFREGKAEASLDVEVTVAPPGMSPRVGPRRATRESPR
jgi:hypothetical protein